MLRVRSDLGTPQGCAEGWANDLEQDAPEREDTNEEVCWTDKDDETLQLEYFGRRNGYVEFSEAGPLRTCAGTNVTTMGPVPVRPPLAPVDEESAPMEDGEGGEDESMQDEAEEGRRPLFRKSENQPSSQDVQGLMKTHIPHRSKCAHCVRGRERNDLHRSGGERRRPADHPHLAIAYAFLKANNPDDPADQGSNPILIGAEAKYGLTLAMAVPGKGNAAPWIAKRVADWLDWLGS